MMTQTCMLEICILVYRINVYGTGFLEDTQCCVTVHVPSQKQMTSQSPTVYLHVYTYMYYLHLQPTLSLALLSAPWSSSKVTTAI